MQVKIAAVFMASIAAILSTSAFALGLGVQIGADHNAGGQHPRIVMLELMRQ